MEKRYTPIGLTFILLLKRLVSFVAASKHLCATYSHLHAELRGRPQHQVQDAYGMGPRVSIEILGFRRGRRWPRYGATPASRRSP
jgi:hypothetical protein